MKNLNYKNLLYTVIYFDEYIIINIFSNEKENETKSYLRY